MTDWITGPGFCLVQPTQIFSKEQLKAEMDELEIKLQEAEQYWAEQKERTA